LRVLVRRDRRRSYAPAHDGPRDTQERIAARRAELDGLEEQLVKQLAEVRAERAQAGSPEVQMAGRAVRVVPERGPGVLESALPAEYQRILAAVPAARPVRPDEPRRSPLTDDLHPRHPPNTSMTAPSDPHATTLTSYFKRAQLH